MNNDGLKDLFIANGIYKDLTDQDYLRYVSNQEVIQSIVTNDKVDFQKLIDIIPSNKVKNSLDTGFMTIDFFLHKEQLHSYTSS